MSAIIDLRNESVSSNLSIIDSLAELNNNFRDLSATVSELKLENTNLCSDLDELKLKVNNSDTHGPSMQTASILTQVLEETFERDRCASNVIIYGVAESLSQAPPERIIDDIKEINQFLEPMELVYPTISKIICLGKARVDYIRPIKIMFDKKDDAEKLITSYNFSKRNESIFPSCFKIVRDKTVLQRQLLRSCHEELEQRIKNGERELRIKYENGLLKVTSIFPKNEHSRGRPTNKKS